MKPLRTLCRLLSMLRKGWKIRFSYTKKHPGTTPGVFITTLCDTIASAEETDRRIAS